VGVPEVVSGAGGSNRGTAGRCTVGEVNVLDIRPSLPMDTEQTTVPSISGSYQPAVATVIRPSMQDTKLMPSTQRSFVVQDH
jgi:hypothetical protein